MLGLSWTAICRRYLPSSAALVLILLPGLSGAQDSSHPERHFSVENPANLTPDEAATIYARIVGDMTDAYALSGDPSAVNYRRWRAFSNSPYPSATHGGRYVGNYGNALAAPYANGAGAHLPEGAVLAKDSFSVNANGDIFPGPLFLMEKMAPGFAPEGRDWRYTMIMPDGSFFGVTGGESADRVSFCAACHQTAGDANDHLFFVPEDFRTRN